MQDAIEAVKAAAANPRNSGRNGIIDALSKAAQEATVRYEAAVEAAKPAMAAAEAVGGMPEL
jgi:hypothetical protein